MIPRLPVTATQLVFLFLLATPVLSLAQPVADPEAAPAPAPLPIPAPQPVPAPASGTLDAPAKLQPRAPQPSRRMGQRRTNKAEQLKKKDYSSFLCPGGSVACPIPPPSLEDITPASISSLEMGLNSLADWFKVGFECIELDTELNSCGGCLALGSGQDCSLIPNARMTGCEAGACSVYSCYDGYVVSPDRTTCVKKGTVTPATPVTAFQSGQMVLEGEVES
ncbi:hypothetical protein M231_07284 [Tremella mesenterica]|uniref:Protein CPL1-like domain-containing protein n=1 Tax=Tremella mesenterica TaxID=5217 RepID=A0A4Q1B9G6_TREME|nr:uncharacterized protein TREMEDRAFT_73346 [Tremella mesenterica DSM 1558]EIW71570.1 hypothetical protein TREMEDRAFT_73346 [Tremella mesenterica DSM 1558]RXK35429.1 hypothetical protein M231_07284 [Tremella mesenterica]